MHELKIKILKPLVQKRDDFRVTASQYEWISRCPLRLAYSNHENLQYKPDANLYAQVGNVIHAVYEAYSQNKINNSDDFQRQWANVEERITKGQGLKFKLPNYGDYVAKTWVIIRDALDKRRSWKEGKQSHEYSILTEETLADHDIGIEGRPDLVILKRGLPIVIKDYKSGSVYESDDQSTTNNSKIKEGYRQQLLLYAWLAKCKFGSYPSNLELVDGKGISIPVQFSQNEIESLIEAIRVLKSKFINNETLETPSGDNCKNCIYRFGCSKKISAVRSEEKYTEITAKVLEVKKPAYGNVVLVFKNGSFNSKNPLANKDQFDSLTGCLVTITAVYKEKSKLNGGDTGVFLPTNNSILYSISDKHA